VNTQPDQPPTLRLLSLGAGVQSTTLLMLAAEGRLPGLDGAIFADTGWEPTAVYEHLDRLEAEVAKPAGIPVYRVSTGRIQDDVLDPDKQRSLPAHTRDPETGEDGMLNRRCTQTYKLTPILRQTRLLLGAQTSDPTPCRYCDGKGERIAPWRAKRGDMTPGPCSVCDGSGVLGHRDVRLAGLCESVGLLRQWAAEVAAVPVVGVAADTTPGFGAPDCTCIPWTREGGKPRVLGPTDTADMIGGWERGLDCPHHRPLVPAQPGNDTKTRIVAYRSRDGRALYCTRHTGEIFGFDWRPVDSDDLPDGGICTYPDCGADVLIPQQPKEARPPVGYSGKGRLWCLTCPRPDREDVPMTIGLVCVGELCAGCGRDVVEVARSTEQQPKEA
jgi:hypothetical protein